MLISSIEYPEATLSSLKATGSPRSTVELLLTPFTCPPKSNLLSSMNRLAATAKYIPQNSKNDKQAQLIQPPSKMSLAVKVFLSSDP